MSSVREVLVLVSIPHRFNTLLDKSLIPVLSDMLKTCVGNPFEMSRNESKLYYCIYILCVIKILYILIPRLFFEAYCYTVYHLL